MRIPHCIRLSAHLNRDRTLSLIDLNVLFSFASIASSQCYMRLGSAESLISKMGRGCSLSR
jgi:hypothetical protein